MTRRVQIKKNLNYFDIHNVFVDGELVADFWYWRERRTRAGRVRVKCTGELKFHDGRPPERLDKYSTFADARRYIIHRFTEELKS